VIGGLNTLNLNPANFVASQPYGGLRMPHGEKAVFASASRIALNFPRCFQ
jgi:hypothetical protein